MAGAKPLLLSEFGIHHRFIVVSIEIWANLILIECNGFNLSGTNYQAMVLMGVYFASVLGYWAFLRMCWWFAKGLYAPGDIRQYHQTVWKRWNWVLVLRFDPLDNPTKSVCLDYKRKFKNSFADSSSAGESRRWIVCLIARILMPAIVHCVSK